MNIHQMSALYVIEQDRILLRISTTQGEEMRLWLVRRLMLGLWPVLNRALSAIAAETPGAATAPGDDSRRQMMADFQHDAFLRQSDFSTPYQAPAQPMMPLGTAPLLVSEVRVTPLGAGQLRVEFQEKVPQAPSQRGFQVELAPQLGHGLLHLLERALAQAQWGPGLPGARVAQAPGQEESPPASESVGRPKYLN